MGEVGTAYAGCRLRIAELVRDLDEATAATQAPACPEWAVRDIVAHVTGVVDDALAGRLDGVATDPWTAAQVAARRGRPIADILAEWDEKSPRFEQLLDAIGAPGRQAVTDVVTHEHDIRGALKRPGARDSDAVGVGLAFAAPGLVASAALRGIALSITTPDGRQFGSPDGTVTLTGPAFELLRAMTGRRSVDQLRKLDWLGDYEPVLDAFVFGPFRPAVVPVEE